MRRYWYLITIRYCPVCLRETEERERMYTERPDDPLNRRLWIEHYDWCEI